MKIQKLMMLEHKTPADIYSGYWKDLLRMLIGFWLVQCIKTSFSGFAKITWRNLETTNKA